MLDLDLRHADLPLPGIVREADVRVAHEAQDGLFVLRQALMEVVCVGLRDPAAFSFRPRRDLGHLPGALGQDGPVALAHGRAPVLGQGLGVAPVDPVAGLAQQPLHQARPAEAVGLDDEGRSLRR